MSLGQVGVMRITPYLMAGFGLIFLIFGLGIDFGETENSFDAIQVLLGLIQTVIGVLLTGHVPLPFLPQPGVNPVEHEDPTKKF